MQTGKPRKSSYVSIIECTEKSGTTDPRKLIHADSRVHVKIQRPCLAVAATFQHKLEKWCRPTSRNISISLTKELPTLKKRSNNSRNDPPQDFPQRHVCPFADPPKTKIDREFALARAKYPLLTDTSCTAEFCQGGRMFHTKDPRIGQQRPLEQIREEAKDFLRQLRQDGVIDTEEGLAQRTEEVMETVSSSSSGAWLHSTQELEHGVRLAWKHSRRCIMRSEYKSLALCDLRHVTTSRTMGQILVEKGREAFNGGDIKPTVFVFPACTPEKSGPCIWNHQLLSFACYRLDEGTILGDPANLNLTEAIIRLGWKPPKIRTKWDLLPCVTQAEDDEPAITPISEDDFPVVKIRHPRYSLQFDRLGLRWVPAPALTRLGFDIGGVQYTAAPFIGWFMDAEIGMRDLVDENRYNALPSIVDALGLLKHTSKTLDEVPEFERLAALSRAQTELNYAVYWSFNQVGVRISDSLTASAMYCNFDDDHFRSHGFRLPADPYWLSPPIGSLVPVWHRGGAPNYQPKPMIAKHAQDPVKTWQRQKRSETGHPVIRVDPTVLQTNQAYQQTIQIAYCSSGVSARKLALSLRSDVISVLQTISQGYGVSPVQTLNEINIQDLTPDDILLIVASSCGRGDIPVNGQAFLQKIRAMNLLDRGFPRYAIFANGSTSYADSFNGAAKVLDAGLQIIGATSLVPTFEADSDAECPPWSQLHVWTKLLREILAPDETGVNVKDLAINQIHTSPTQIRQKALQSLSMECIEAGVVSSSGANGGIQHVVLDIGASPYPDMGLVDVFVPNCNTVISRLTERFHSLGTCPSLPGSMTLQQFLTHFVEVEHPFTNISWASHLAFDEAVLEKLKLLSVRDAIEVLVDVVTDSTQTINLTSIIAALPLRPPRHYSIASHMREGKQINFLHLYVQAYPGGLFSDKYLSLDADLRPPLRIRLRKTVLSTSLSHHNKNGPLIVLVTGSGIAPLCAYLQGRTDAVKTQKSPTQIPTQAPITVLAAFRSKDRDLIETALDEPTRLGLIDIKLLKVSTDDKTATNSPNSDLDIHRVQDEIFNATIQPRILAKLRNPTTKVFVCANRRAAEGLQCNLSAILGADIRLTLAERYVEEIFDAAT